MAADLGVAHSVISARIEVIPELSGGLLIKLRMYSRALMLVVVNPDQDIELMSVLRRFVRGWSLAKDDRGAAEFDRCVPTIGYADWDAITINNHVVQVGIRALATTLDIELAFAGGRRLPLLLTAGAASRLEVALGAALPHRLKHPHVPTQPGHA
jgi:hypothetical protein